MEDKNGHRVLPSKKRMIFDERCQNCECPKIADIWEEELGITQYDTRKTLNVEKLRQVIKEIIREASK